MIKNKKIKIKVNPSNYNYYKKFYDDIKSGTEIEIDITHLYKNSKTKIDAVCDVCGKEIIIAYDMYNKNYNNCDLFTCKKCSYIKTKKTNLERYGVENVFESEEIKEKSKKTCFEKYGVEFVQQTKFFIDGVKKTIFEKYGVEHHLQIPEILEKQKKTNLEKYGVEHASENEKIKSKITKMIKKSWKKKSCKIYPNVLKIENDILTFYCEKCEKEFKIIKQLYQNRKKLKSEICTICNPLDNQISDKENQLLNFIKENYYGNIVESDRKILNGKELDIYLPELNLAFEFNGLYWHSEFYKDKNYHLNKTESCLEKNIQLIHIYEDEWIYKQDIVKSMILNKLKKNTKKIYARKTIIKKVTDNKIIRDFLNKNHIQGFVGSSIKLGLFYENELVSLMTFGKKRKFMNSNSKEGEYELLRFCNKLNTNVVGGASKLFKYFERNYNFSEIITYADRSYSQGKLYETLGFNFISKTQPNYYYIISKKKYHRFNFRKDVLVKEGYNQNKTEHEIMLERNIYRIYNSGSLKFIYS